MTTTVATASLGLIVAGPWGAVVGAMVPWAAARIRKSGRHPRYTRLVILILLVEVRSGVSVLAALQAASAALFDHDDLRRVARVATVSGLSSAIAVAGSLEPLIAQLARAQSSGASLTAVLQSMVERDLAAEKARRIAKARSLPVRLMIPVTLLMLPGLVLLLYAPSLLGLFTELTGTWR